MVADPIIELFMEDIAHEQFVTSLVQRIATEVGVQVKLNVRNATGGIPRMRGQISRFLRDHKQALIGSTIFDILIIVQDADRYSESEIRNEMRRQIDRADYQGVTIIAVPEPCIEAWYLADRNYLQALTGLSEIRRKDDYKHYMAQIFQNSPLGGGIEYANEIAENMDLYQASRNVSSLGHFIDEVRSELRQLAQSS